MPQKKERLTLKLSADIKKYDLPLFRKERKKLLENDACSEPLYLLAKAADEACVTKTALTVTGCLGGEEMLVILGGEKSHQLKQILVSEQRPFSEDYFVSKSGGAVKPTLHLMRTVSLL
jgi:hypothetical protein